MKILLTLCFLISFSAYSIDTKSIFRDKTTIKNPFELRDPFLPPKFKVEQKKKISSKKADGVFDNRAKIESAKDYNLDDVTIVGVIIGKERRVSVKLPNGENIFILKEGDKLGSDRAEIKAIMAGGIILVEKVTNIYGEDEYIETVIPISR